MPDRGERGVGVRDQLGERRPPRGVGVGEERAQQLLRLAPVSSSDHPSPIAPPKVSRNLVPEPRDAPLASASMSDWKIGDDRPTTHHRPARDLREANDGQVAWDTEAPADFTYLYHPDRVLVRAEDVDGVRASAVAALDEGVLDGEPRRDDADLLDGELVRYLLPERAEGESVPDVLDLLEADRPASAARPRPTTGCTSPPAAAAAALCPAIEPEETGLNEPWPPRCATEEQARASASSSWTPAGTRPPATDPRTPWLQGVDGDDELNGPDLRPYAGHGTFIAGRRALHGAGAPKIFVEGFAIGGVGGGGILESDLVVQLERGARPRPAGHQPVGRLPHPRGPALDRASRRSTAPTSSERDCVLVAAAGNDSWAAPFWPAAFDWASASARSTATAGSRSFSNYGVSADVYALGPQPGQRVPRRHLRVPRDARQGRRPGVQHRAWRGGAVRRSPRPSSPG